MGNGSASRLTTCLGDNATSYEDLTILGPDDATCSYDVFLSFRGEDTRDSFTDHLYDALARAGFLTFRDDDEINRGRELKPQIERAIKASKASIVVLSDKYATSTWCLDELWLILEQWRECNHFVLPVFYHVDPSDVRKQNKTFKIRVKTSTRWTYDNVKRWKAALTKVADFSSFVVSGPETKLVKEIVDTIYSELDHKKVYLPRNLTGMDIRYEEITSWLYQSDLTYLAICGMGGSGKTTLAKYIYNSNWKKFESMSFLEDIGRKFKESHDLVEPQKQLLTDILGGRKRKIPSVSHGTCKIEEALQTKRVLIVLDDIVEETQLVALLGTGEINAQSKIIITTENTDNWFMFSSSRCRCQQYKMKLLNEDESLELLSLHAFGCKIPTQGFKDLAVQAVKYCEGNPLALQVLGSSLSKGNTIQYWKSQLRVLTKDFHSRIEDVLKRGYESLPFSSEKELFLHIACFFIGKDVDYVETILEPDYSAVSGIKTLTDRCLVSVSPNNKLMMHRLLQEMGRNVVRQESLNHPMERSRVWLSGDSYKILKKGEGSKAIEGLTLDMKMLREEEEEEAFMSSDLTTDAFTKMEKLKLLQLNFVQLTGSYENFSADLRWLCWLGFRLRTIPSGLYMGKMVAVDMSYSNLEVFDPPMVLHSLQILNLKDSHNLFEIRNIYRIPRLETLILWNCHNLVNVCKTIGDLKNLSLLNMTGCQSLCKKRDLKNLLIASTSTSTSGRVTEPPPISFPHSLRRLFLNDCNLECTDSFPLSFNVQPFLQYLNLSNGLFEFLPYYDHLINLRVLDLSFCSRLKWLLRLPSTLAELYVYSCKSLEKITFQSPRFMLQEIGYDGCINLAEIEGFIKLVPIAKLDETDLGHLKWLKKYQRHEVLLVGDDELTNGRSSNVQMLHEFDIMSTSLPEIEDSNTTPEYVSKSPCLSFDVPLCPTNRRLKGLNVTLKYTLSGDDWAWFAKISTNNGVDLMYNPRVFGKPRASEVCIWLSYWPIGNTLKTGDTVNVSIAVMSGLEVHECGACLVYTDDEIAHKTLENNNGWVETLGGNLTGFQLSTGAYYLCRRDFSELIEVGRLNPGWLSTLVGDAIDYAEIRGWRKTGRPKQSNPSFTELKTVRCIIHGPQQEEIYKIPEMSKSSLVDKTVEFTSNVLGLGETIKSTVEFSFVAGFEEIQEEKKMVKEQVFIGSIYQGTTSTRFIIYDKHAQPIGSHQVEFTQFYPEAGWVEHDPMEILESVRICIEKVIDKATSDGHNLDNGLKAIGITNQRETTIVWSKSTGVALYNAIVWMDIRTSSICRKLEKELSGGKTHFLESCGLPISTYFSAPKLLWLLENVDAVKTAVKKGDALFGTIDSWLIWNLTGGVDNGIHVTDVSNASRTMLMSLTTLDWDESTLKTLKIPKSILPKIVSNAEVIGHIGKEWLIPGIPISGCLGDQHAAMLGQSCRKGEAKSTYGTDALILLNTGKEVIQSKHGLLTTLAFKLGRDARTNYALEGSIAIAGAAVEWLRDGLGIISSASEIEELAAQVDSTGGVYFVPAFNGLFAPWWRDDARGVCIGITRFTNKSHIARAVLESICFQVNDVLDSMHKDVVGEKGDIKNEKEQLLLRVDGGATVNNTLMQIQADLLGNRVVRPADIETTALGAAYAAGLAVGVWTEEEIFSNVERMKKDTIFKPALNEESRNKKVASWCKAVERSFDLADLSI